MITAFRDLAIGVCALLTAFVVAAAGQVAFEYAAPSLSDRIIGSTNLGTYALITVLGCLLFVAGIVVPRWLRTSRPLFWLVLPIIAVYFVAVFDQPHVYRCNPATVAGCWVVSSPFLVGLIAVVAGYFFSKKGLAHANA